MTALDALMRPPTPDDPRTAVQRRADALVELARQALDGGTLPTVGGVRPHLGLLLTPETLLGLRTPPARHRPPPPAAANRRRSGGDDGAAAARRRARMAHARRASDGGGRRLHRGPATARPADALECAGVPMAPELPWSTWADRLPASVAQRIACDCEVWRVILDPATGLPLEVGRAHRIVPHWIRKALHRPRPRLPMARMHRYRRLGREVHHLLAWYYRRTVQCG